MLKRMAGLLVVVLLILSVPAASPQQDQAQTVYTYVSQFQVPRANWAQFSEDTEKTVNPILQRLMADGTIIGWLNFETIVHTPDGMTHGSAWQATSLAGITRVLDEVRKGGPRPGQIAATRHEDLLMRSVLGRFASVSNGTGYLLVHCGLTQPGKAGAFVALLQKYFGATWEDQLKKGNVTSFGIDEQYVQTNPGSLRCGVFTFPSAEAMDKNVAAANALFAKMTPEELKGFGEGIATTLLADSRRDTFARITHYAHK